MGFWNKRKLRNRRVERCQILDVKIRSHQARAERLRLASSVVGVVLGTGAGLFLLYHCGLWLLEEGVLRNEAFAISSIDVQTDGQVPISELRRRIEVSPGDNLLALDLGRVKRDLELEPWIEGAVVERIFPHTLRVRVTEREPMARIYAFQPRRSGAGYDPVVFHVDPAGYVMRPRGQAAPNASPGSDDEYLPTLAGINTAELKPGQRLESPLAHAALRLIAAFENSPMFGLVELAQVDLTGPDILRVSTRQGTGVTFGVDTFETQLRRWHTIHEAGLRLGKAIASLDLSMTNNLPAKWIEASAVPPLNPKSVKPSRTKKKHV
jgi:cell division septal protein FtsQ